MPVISMFYGIIIRGQLGAGQLGRVALQNRSFVRPTMDWDVISVKALPEHRLAVELADGRKGVFDLRPFLDRPGLQRLKDPSYFAQVGIRLGALTWPHEEDIAPDTLSAHIELVAVA